MFAIPAVGQADQPISITPSADRILSEAIKPDNPNLYYVGRFDRSDPAGPRCQWPASMVTVRFKGTDLQASITDSGDNYFQVVVDGIGGHSCYPGKGDHVLDLARDLSAGEHTVQFTKRTEAYVGTVQFRGFYLNPGGGLLQPQRLKRKLQIIGDSISCGFGNESPTVHDRAYQYENAWMSYGAIAARALNAEYICTAWSGRKLTDIDAIYAKTLPTAAVSPWDISSWQPDVLLINLGTNDFGAANPDEEQWTGQYETFLRAVRKNNPQSLIYIATGSMMSDSWPPGHEALSKLKSYLQRVEDQMRAEGDTKIRHLDFDPQNIKLDGAGAGTHPNVITHAKMAERLVQAVGNDLGWKMTDTK